MAGNYGHVCHWGPIIALSIIGTISIVTHGVLLATHPFSPFYQSRTDDDNSFFGVLQTVLEYGVYVLWHFAILVNFFRAVYLGPGFVPLKWHPPKPEHRNYLQFCESCKGFKPPRAHHCRRCERCILKMDHHCPWINGCTGQRNQASFIYFLFFCPLGCLHSLIHLVPVVYHFFYAEWYYHHNPEIFVQLVHIPWWFFIMIFLSSGLAVGVIGAVGSLFFVQMRQAVRNKTSVEEYIISKADWIRERHMDATENPFPPFVFPYDLGWRRNLVEVFMKPYNSDYLSWSLRPGCNPFDFTVEQLRQKRVKRDRATPFEIFHDYNGRWLPVFRFGWRTACCPPWPDEPRLTLKPGDIVNVTRARGRWLYGELVAGEKALRKRGWFPERSARMIVYADDENDDENDNNHSKME